MTIYFFITAALALTAYRFGIAKGERVVSHSTTALLFAVPSLLALLVTLIPMLQTTLFMIGTALGIAVLLAVALHRLKIKEDEKDLETHKERRAKVFYVEKDPLYKEALREVNQEFPGPIIYGTEDRDTFRE